MKRTSMSSARMSQNDPKLLAGTAGDASVNFFEKALRPDHVAFATKLSRQGSGGPRRISS